MKHNKRDEPWIDSVTAKVWMPTFGEQRHHLMIFKDDAEMYCCWHLPCRNLAHWVWLCEVEGTPIRDATGGAGSVQTTGTCTPSLYVASCEDGMKETVRTPCETELLEALQQCIPWLELYIRDGAYAPPSNDAEKALGAAMRAVFNAGGQL